MRNPVGGGAPDPAPTRRPHLDHLREVARVCQLQHNVQLAVLNERVQILDDVWMVQLLSEERKRGSREPLRGGTAGEVGCLGGKACAWESGRPG